MISEISTKLDKPDAIFVSVGGGGMLGGVITGCGKVGWDDVPIIALETIGCNCFHHSFLLNTGASSDFATKLPPSTTKVHDEGENVDMVHFHEFSSKASGSLGASQPSAHVLKMALERQGDVRCVSVQDELSMRAAIRFAEDHKIMVELACSTTLVPAYYPELLNRLVPYRANRTVVFIACGGFKVSLDDFYDYERHLEKNSGRERSVVIGDGEALGLRY
ncbi:serine dehydratase [Moniliophthora roreri]|nr:serine dehydratase [Moniliophthora roreri]